MGQKVVDNYGLTPQQKKFADTWLADPEHNGTRAYREAYPKANQKSAEVRASKLLRHAKVAAYINDRMEALDKETFATQARIIEEYARLGFQDPRRLFDEEGRIKAISDMESEVAAAITSIEMENVVTKDEEGNVVIESRVKKIGFNNKKGSLDSLSKILGMFKEKVDHSVKIEGGVLLVPPQQSEDEWAKGK